MHYDRVLHRWEASLFGARPWCDESAVISDAQPAFTWHVNVCHCANGLLGDGKIRELAARARRAALAVIGLCIMAVGCTGERLLSSGVRPWCDVRAVISNAQPALMWYGDMRTSATALTVSRDVAKRVGLPRARAEPRQP